MSKGFGGVKMVNYILVPVLVLGILFSGEKYLNNVDICMSADDKTIFLSVVSSIIYTCYNMITVIPAVVLLAGSNNRKVCLFSCVAASALLFACAVSVASIINTDFAENMAFSIPIIKAVEGRSSFVRYTIIVSIIFSMATTAAAAGCWANDYVEKEMRRKTYPFIMAAAYVMSMFDFSVFVDRMYFLFGAAAVYEVYKILKS